MSISRLNWDRMTAAGASYGYNIPAECFDVTYEGCVLETREENWPDDSDYYANVWDDATQSIKKVYYASTRGGGSDYNGAVADITPENLAKANAHLQAEFLKRAEYEIRAELKHGAIGQRVKVARGRKVPKGFEGVVMSEQEVPAYRHHAGSLSYDERFVWVIAEHEAWFVKAAHLDVLDSAEEIERRVAEHMTVMRKRAERVGYQRGGAWLLS